MVILPCCFVYMHISEYHVIGWHGLLRKAWVIISSCGYFLGLYKGRQAGWSWKTLVLTHTFTGIPSLPLARRLLILALVEIGLENKKREWKMLLHCYFSSLPFPPFSSQLRCYSIKEQNHPVFPWDILLQITSLHVLILSVSSAAASTKPQVSIMHFLH